MTAVQGKGSVTDNDVFIYPKESELSADDLRGFVEYNGNTLGKHYKENIGMYKGHYPILDQDAKPMNKPDNRIVINFAKYITDIFNGFFIGIPPQITLDNESNNGNLQAFNNANSFVDKLSEVAKQTSIYGRSYMFLYQNEDSQTKVAISAPTNSFIIYDDTVAQEPLYFVRYTVDEDNKMSGTVYSATDAYSFDDSYKVVETLTQLFKAVPAIEFIENEERLGAFDSVKTIMNAINSALSQKANDVAAIADAYFFAKGAEISEDDFRGLADNRVLTTDSADADAKFLERPNGDGTQENLVNRLEDKLFLTAMVSNLNDLDSGAQSSASGYSIELRMQAMRGLASNKERKYTSAMRDLYRIVFNITDLAKPSVVKKVTNAIMGKQQPEPADELKFQFTRNLPKNVADEASTAKTLEGIVSKQTQLSVLSIVDNPTDEIDRMASEQKDAAQQAVDNNPANYDFQGVSDEKD
ncbi:phage portal protein [Latilactobacillus fuchuensis]|uniref:phage portal protein n=1 Tax=Latilactobacillus fuchuensis TaxID=164393 RepID=UPI0039B04FF4